MTFQTTPTSAVDELAKIRAQLAGLKAREAELCDEILSHATASGGERVMGAELDARIETRRPLRIDPARLPAEILGNSEFYTTEKEVVILLWPKSNTASVTPTVSAATSDADAVAEDETAAETAAETPLDIAQDDSAASDQSFPLTDVVDAAQAAADAPETLAMEPMDEHASKSDATEFAEAEVAPDLSTAPLDVSDTSAPDADHEAGPTEAMDADFGADVPSEPPVADLHVDDVSTDDVLPASFEADGDVMGDDTHDIPSSETAPAALEAELGDGILAQNDTAEADLAMLEDPAPEITDTTVDIEAATPPEAPAEDAAADTAPDTLSAEDAIAQLEAAFSDALDDPTDTEETTSAPLNEEADAFAFAAESAPETDMDLTASPALGDFGETSIEEAPAPDDLKPTAHAELQPLAGLDQEEIAAAEMDAETPLAAPDQTVEIDEAATLEAQADALFAARVAMESGASAFEKTTAALTSAIGETDGTSKPRAGDFAEALSQIDAEKDASESAFSTRRTAGAPS